MIPAYICILHTFGRSLIFNPHMHMILMGDGISNKSKEFVKVNFLSYPSFRKRFMKVLLDLLEDDIGKAKFRKVKNAMYFKYKERFYVYAPPSKYKSYVDLVKDVCRYVARSVMAESRITDYDGTFVTFWYQRRNDYLIIIEKIHAYEFIVRLIVHIPDYNFKQIRFYGAYHNFTKITIDVQKLVSKKKSDYQKKLNNWRSIIIINFEVNQINCPICNNTIIYYRSVYT